MKLTQRRHRNRRLALEQVENRRLLSADGIGEEPCEIITVRLETTDLDGAPVTQIDAGDDFLLNAYVQDTRARAAGVFAMYMDVTYDAELANVTGPPQFMAPYNLGTSQFPADVSTDGLIDEVGAFTVDVPLEPGAEVRLFSIATYDISHQSECLAGRGSPTSSLGILVTG